uniref:CAZy families GH13 protein n=1 Tax=uncultured Actinosynnema sp. TaxID=905025 RepID=A0A060CBP5_9PSEU|nr:CAZy families GH13 protein [uncultured Actinosynnema sp.]
MFHHYRRLIELRHTDEVVREGVTRILWPDDDQLFCLTRTLGERRLLVLANLSGRPAGLPGDAPDLTRAGLVLTTHPDLPADRPVLAPWESRVLRLS